ncbi:MAG: hypothetical protein R3194_00875, partial [Limnobacter sp.]|nr:hypothetical protein [Limnobacter sp.]
MNAELKQIGKNSEARRNFLRQMLFTAGGLTAAQFISACGGSGTAALMQGGSGVNPQSAGPSPFASMGPLMAPDANGIRMPAGFTSRVIAVFNEPPIPTQPDFVWHSDPDGG